VILFFVIPKLLNNCFSISVICVGNISLVISIDEGFDSVVQDILTIYRMYCLGILAKPENQRTETEKKFLEALKK